RCRNLNGGDRLDFIRGYNLQGRGERHEWMDKKSYLAGFGKGFKHELATPGSWAVWMGGYGECLPYYDNQISLDFDNRDMWGMPLVKVDFSFHENKKKMMKDIQDTAEEILIN